MATRDELHKLVDSLPEAAFEPAQQIFGFGGGGTFDSTRGSGSAGTSFWEDDTLVAETLRLHKGHQLVIKERIRLDAGKTLIYMHSVEGPGNKLDQHEIRFDVVPNAPG